MGHHRRGRLPASLPIPLTSFETIDFHGLPAIRWRGPGGAHAIATLQGAQIVSWIPASGEEALFLSERSAYEAGRAIRGGIPVCFPQFADRGPLAQHGFARTQAWTFQGTSETRQGLRATFSLESTAATLALWPHAFRLELAAIVGSDRLDVELRVENRGAAELSFTAALHTYLRVSDVAAARLEGLQARRFVNRGSNEACTEERPAIPADEPVDRVYFATPAATRVRDAARSFRVEQRGFTDTVVWNPGAERAARMADMAPDGHRRMLCVEAAAIEPPVRLAPGARWSGAQAITATR